MCSSRFMPQKRILRSFYSILFPGTQIQGNFTFTFKAEKTADTGLVSAVFAG